MSDIINLPQQELEKHLASTNFLYQPHCTIVHIDNHPGHYYSMSITVPKGKKILINRNKKASSANPITELHIYFYDTTPPPIPGGDILDYTQNPVSTTINGKFYDLYLAFFSIASFSGKDEELFIKVMESNSDMGILRHNGTIHKPKG